MLKLKKSMKNRSAVSPVIATILMVAITVVLAAVLYVMVMGFGGGDTSSITGSFTNKAKVGDAERLTFGAFTPEIAGDDIKLVVAVSGGPDTYLAASNTYVWGTNSWAISGTANDLGPIDTTKTISFSDLGADGKISNGDSASITHLGTGVGAGTYTITVTILNANTGDTVNSIEYNWIVT